MVSDELLKRLEDFYRFPHYELARRLRDFTDEEVRRIGKAIAPRTVWTLIEALAEGADPEVNAHLRGWDSYEQQEAELRAIIEQQKALTKGQRREK